MTTADLAKQVTLEYEGLINLTTFNNATVIGTIILATELRKISDLLDDTNHRLSKLRLAIDEIE